MKDNTCMYCSQNDALKDIMIYIGELETSKLYLFKNQAMKGRCVLAYSDHVNEFHELDAQKAAAFARDMRTVALAISKAFSPDKINFGMYNDNGKHLHCHIVPKYKGGVNFGTTFEMNPSPAVLLTDAEYDEIISRLKENLL